jgi:hypothetical protein
MIHFVGTEVIRVVIANQSLGKSVKLVGTVEMHSADLNWFVSCRT